MNISSTFLCTVDAETEWNSRTAPNSSTISPGEISDYKYYESEIYITIGFILFVCGIGCAGNGIVVWLLGFQIKKNTYTTYILNLAMADFGVLITIAFYCIVRRMIKPYKMLYFEIFFDVCLLFTYTTSQLLLTAISIERCVSVLFPVWHRCYQPPHLSTTVCVLIWVISFLLSVILPPLGAFIFCKNLTGYFLTTTSFLCLSLVTVTTVILFWKIWFKSHWQHKEKPYMIISLTFLVFLILGYPLNGLVLFSLFSTVEVNLTYYGLLCTSLNSSMNPLIYYLFGRRKGAQSKESMKVILQSLVNGGSRKEVNPSQLKTDAASIESG